MQALTFEAVGAVRCAETAEPELVEPRDAIVRVEVAGLCGSDLHVYRGNETGLDRGTILGHEFVGELVAVGGGVDSLRSGARVVSAFTASCGRCFYCERGLTARCVESALFGWVEGGRGLHGAQAEYVRVPLADATLLPVPEGLDPELALFAGDVLATGFHCAESGGVSAGQLVAVLGCGPVGLMAIVGARELGAGQVVAIDSVAERLALAESFGATAVPLDSARARVLELTDGRGADVVLEAVGSAAAGELAFELVRPGGTISAAGVHTEPHFAFSPGQAYDKNLTYRAGRCPARAYMERMLALAQSGSHPLASIISHRLPLSEGPRAYELFDQKLEGCTKVLFKA